MEMDRLYDELNPCPSDPFGEAGREKHAETERLLRARGLAPVFDALAGDSGGSGDPVRVLDLCAGAGFGGVAAATLLRERDVKAEVVFTDLRSSVLDGALALAREHAVAATSAAVSATDVHTLEGPFDLVLLLGRSTPHFDPWDWARVLAAVRSVLAPGGVLLVDEIDRRSPFRRPLGDVRYDRSPEGHVIVSTDEDYDAITGSVSRLAYRLDEPARQAVTGFFSWGLSECAALGWCFFEEVGALPQGRDRYYVVLRRPRASLDRAAFEKRPRRAEEARTHRPL
jgi:SAM-dependent methyltransferase